MFIRKTIKKKAFKYIQGSSKWIADNLETVKQNVGASHKLLNKTRSKDFNKLSEYQQFRNLLKSYLNISVRFSAT